MPIWSILAVALPRHVRRQVERQGNRLQLALVVDRRRSHGALNAGKARQRPQLAGLVAHRDFRERIVELAVGVGRLQDHVIAGRRRINGRTLPLAKRQVQRGAHVAERHAQVVGLVAVDLERGLQATILGIAGDVAEIGIGTQLLQVFLRPLAQRAGADRLQGVLVAAFRLPSAQLQVLHRAQIHGHAGDRPGGLAQAVEYLRHLVALPPGL